MSRSLFLRFSGLGVSDSHFFSTFLILENDENKIQMIVYLCIWQGLGRVRNIKVGNGHKTITTKPDQDLRHWATDTKKKFASKGLHECNSQ